MDLTLSWRRPLSYRNVSIDLQSKSVDWFLYDNALRQERLYKTNRKQNRELIKRKTANIVKLKIEIRIARNLEGSYFKFAANVQNFYILTLERSRIFQKNFIQSFGLLQKFLEVNSSYVKLFEKKNWVWKKELS